MSNGNNTAAITSLVNWAIQAGASIAEARQALKDAGVDETIYEKVIADHRTFKDFHGANPQGTVVADPPAPDPQPPVTFPIAFAYNTRLDAKPDVAQLQNGDSIYSDGAQFFVLAHGVGGQVPEGFVLVEDVHK